MAEYINEEPEVVTISQACIMLGIDKHNAFKLLKQAVLKDAGMRNVAGAAFQRHVFLDSVMKYKNRKLVLDDDVQTFKMRMHISLYKAVCDGTATEKDMAKLASIFKKASNETIKGQLYRKLRDGKKEESEDTLDAMQDPDELFDKDFDVDNLDAADEGDEEE